jgi:hypothetical protein
MRDQPARGARRAAHAAIILPSPLLPPPITPLASRLFAARYTRACSASPCRAGRFSVRVPSRHQGCLSRACLPADDKPTAVTELLGGASRPHPRVKSRGGAEKGASVTSLCANQLAHAARRSQGAPLWAAPGRPRRATLSPPRARRDALRLAQAADAATLFAPANPSRRRLQDPALLPALSRPGRPPRRRCVRAPRARERRARQRVRPRAPPRPRSLRVRPATAAFGPRFP